MLTFAESSGEEYKRGSGGSGGRGRRERWFVFVLIWQAYIAFIGATPRCALRTLKDGPQTKQFVNDTTRTLTLSLDADYPVLNITGS